jgi:hypothetical protein
LVVADLPVQRAELLVLDATMAVGVELVEVDLTPAGTGSAVGFDGNADEAELQVAFPTGTCSHGKKTPCHLRVGFVPLRSKEAAAGMTLFPECGSLLRRQR